MRLDALRPLRVVERDGGDAVSELGEHTSHGRHPSQASECVRRQWVRAAGDHWAVPGPRRGLAYPAGMGASEVQVTLDAVIVAVTDETPRVLAVLDPPPPIRAAPSGAAGEMGERSGAGAPPFRLPSGLLDADDRTLGARRPPLRASAGRPQVGYVEQLYTFGDLDRSPPVGPSRGLVARPAGRFRPAAPGSSRSLTWRWSGSRPSAGAAWLDWYDLTPGRTTGRVGPQVLDATDRAARARAWIDAAPDAAERTSRGDRATVVFGLGGVGWDGVRVLERYELAYELGLLEESPSRPSWRTTTG